MSQIEKETLSQNTFFQNFEINVKNPDFKSLVSNPLVLLLIPRQEEINKITPSSILLESHILIQGQQDPTQFITSNGIKGTLFKDATNQKSHREFVYLFETTPKSIKTIRKYIEKQDFSSIFKNFVEGISFPNIIDTTRPSIVYKSSIEFSEIENPVRICVISNVLGLPSMIPEKIISTTRFIKAIWSTPTQSVQYESAGVRSTIDTENPSDPLHIPDQPENKQSLFEDFKVAINDFKTFLDFLMKSIPQVYREIDNFITSILSSSKPTTKQTGVEMVNLINQMIQRIEDLVPISGHSKSEYQSQIQIKLEKWIVEETYDRIYYQNSDIDHQKDHEFAEKMKRLFFVELEHFDTKSRLSRPDIFQETQKELRKITEVKPPNEKLNCITDACKILGKIFKSNEGADDFLPVFFYVVLKSNIPRLPSTIEFLQFFTDEQKLIMSEQGYYFTNIFSAKCYIENLKPENLTIDPISFALYFSSKPKFSSQKLNSGLTSNANSRLSQNITSNSIPDYEKDYLLKQKFKIEHDFIDYETYLSQNLLNPVIYKSELAKKEFQNFENPQFDLQNIPSFKVSLESAQKDLLDIMNPFNGKSHNPKFNDYFLPKIIEFTNSHINETDQKSSFDFENFTFDKISDLIEKYHEVHKENTEYKTHLAYLLKSQSYKK
ncbi:rab gdp/gtp exchange factor [Anaeramoeba ignava]|uniref:Rab gdp/gtp exchange factor n=1 Tax=Anaeramoeba ignava TaxID=1746090 RepID=A0A9Q0LVC2_ANAIG|nr:rab gdp/gtp exchange factor [Anaeramoeba ignava]